MLRLLALLAVLLGPVHLAAEEVDLELVLLADASRSIDDREIAFQRQGYAQAILHRDFLSAVALGTHGRIAVTYVEWADAASQDVVVGWTVIAKSEDAEGFVAALLTGPRRAFGSNAIGSALLRGKALIEENGIEAQRRVIDFSADSANNWGGPPIETARDAVIAAGITINGLAVLCRDCSGQPVSYDLEAAFRDRIIGGPGAFVVTADGRESFARAVRRKLILEVAGSPEAARFAEMPPIE